MTQTPPRKLGRASSIAIERSIWSITYPVFGIPPWRTVNYTENGIVLSLAKVDIDMAQQSFERVLDVFGTSMGTIAGAAGTIVLPGGGTIAGAAAGTALGRALTELGKIALDVAKYLAVDDKGGFEIHMAPHGFQCGDNFAGDPNVFLGPLWKPVYAAMAKLQPPRGAGILAATHMSPAKVDKTKPMSGGRRSPANAAGGVEVDDQSAPAKKPKKDTPADEPAAAGVAPATSPAAARMVPLNTAMTGTLPLGKTHYWKFKPPGTKLKFKVYTRLLADTHAVEGSLAVSDMEGGVIDRSTFQASEQGDDFSVETIDIALEEKMDTAVLSIKSKQSLSDRADIEYKIKLA